ncbi:Histone-lysine N-methyltransferase SETMAR [Holothuria leucospilota]|uniref:Histone-lysine N-methyltransferase SETMAR n=1 Tax=Holothuria leucospilota TaxID=206669 RepID=A0A9Q1CMA4_HOLLE|nr:Histone-lysine N-methyltransferase SETMAR [Holothuria leucospilota]
MFGDATDPLKRDLHHSKYDFYLVFTATNVAGSGYSSNPDEITNTGCTCGVPLCPPECPCISQFGPNYDERGSLLKVEHGIKNSSKPIVECNGMCHCGETCSNRVVQNGIHFNLEIFMTEDRGRGLKTTSAIPKHRFVCEYAGELLGRAEAERRLKSLKEDEANYILIVKEHTSDGDVVETIIDPTYRGNIGRCINHSCEPNLFLVPVRVHNDIPRIALFAKRDIAAGEELTYSYGEEMEGVLPLGKVKRKPCFCGTSSCQKYLPLELSLFT